MENTVGATFYVKRFTSAKDKDFVKALMLYNDTIPVDTKTSSNEIMYFADHCSLQPKRIMYFFGLYWDNHLVGFVEAAYLSTTKTIIIDYIVLKEEYRLNSVFYPLFSLIQRFFSENMVDYDYIATEVSTKCPDQSVDAESFFSKKMLQIEDFRIADVLYRQPRLGLDNHESNFDFQLMIKSKQSMPFIKKETYLSIVYDIYFEHYYPWYEVADEARSSEYRKHLESEYDQVKTKVEQVVGDIVLSNQAISCAYYKAPDCHFNGSTAGFVPGKKHKTARRLIFGVGIPCVTVGAFVVSMVAYYVLKKMNIQPDMFAGLFAAVSAAFTGILTLAFSAFARSKS